MSHTTTPTQTLKPTAGQRSMERRMTKDEADRLAVAYRAMPRSSFYRSISEYTGKERTIQHADAVYILTVRGYISESVAA